MWCNSKSARLSSVAKTSMFEELCLDTGPQTSETSCLWSSGTSHAPGHLVASLALCCLCAPPAPSDFSTVDKSVGLPPLHRPLLLGLSHVVPWTTSQLIRHRPVFRDPCWARILFLPWLPPLTTCLDLPHLVLGCFWILHYDSSFGLLVP